MPRLWKKLVKRNATGRWRRFIGPLLGGLLFSSSAGACQVCIPFPRETLADRLLKAETVVLAREDPQRPFHFVAVETLKGEPGAPTIDVFLNSQTRRTLAANPEHAMMLARNSGSGEWKTLGIADADVSKVIRRIIGHAGSWSPRETGNPQRLEEFALLLGHDNRLLHELAYLEIGRASYGAIRKISASVSIDRVRTMLDDPGYLEWRSLAILMLAQSGNPADEARIRKTFNDKQGFGGTLNLPAWATAYIAVDGANAVADIERLYLSRPGRSPEELSAVLKALSTQANDDRGLRNRIVSAYRTLLEVHPEHADEIARDLITWRRWDLVDQVRAARVQMGGTDPLGAYALDLYLRTAAAHRGELPGDPAEPKPPITSSGAVNQIGRSP